MSMAVRYSRPRALLLLLLASLLVVACAGDASDAAASAQESARSWTDLAKDKLNLFSK